MNRIDALFARKQRQVLSVYCTAGFPHADSTRHVLRALQESGVDMIELGMPYSDPLADGPVIQDSSIRAIRNGMSIPRLFEELEGFREEIRIPLLLMGYMNPVLQYGFESFCARAAGLGVDGLILPDLPPEDFDAEFGSIIRRYGLGFSFLVTPETEPDRVRELDRRSSGFLYAVSSSSTTGLQKDISAQHAYFSTLRELHLTNPVMAGFGIHDRKSFLDACAHTNGAIIGTAYIRALDQPGSIQDLTKSFIHGIIGN